jgi:DNA-binding response OmpR family regulator
LKGKRILVIDDDESTRALVSHALTKAGAVVVSAADADGAMKAASHDRVDLILLDLKMPDFDGMTLLRTLGMDADPPPVVILSGVESKHITQQAVVDGAVGFVHKPIDLRTFAAKVSRILNWAELE